MVLPCSTERRGPRRRRGGAPTPSGHCLSDQSTATESGGVRGVWLDVVGLGKEATGPAGPVTLLHDVSLSIRPGEFVGLVGSSGAGKSTLLGTLAGLQRADRGQILLDGADSAACIQADRTLVGYLPQDDIVHGELTVSAALRYTAALRRTNGASTDVAAVRVRNALAAVALETQSEQRVDSLSGGQRKRASLAAELVAQPSLLLLDEPTSGSDPALDEHLMRTLRGLADAGRSIVVATHATAHLDQCDLLAVMTRGRLVFVGPPAAAPTFFGVSDLHAVFVALEGGGAAGDADVTASAWEQRFRHSWYYDLYVAQRLRRCPTATAARSSLPVSQLRGKAAAVATGLQQWWALTQRAFELTSRDRTTAGVRFAVVALVGLVIALVTHPQDLVGLDAVARATRPGYNAAVGAQNVLFILALAAGLLGLFAGVNEILRERSVYQRERLAGLGVVPYVVAKLTLVAALSVAGSALLFLVVWLHLHIPATTLLLPAAAELYVTLLLSTLAGASLGLFLSAVARSTTMAAYFLKFAIFGQIVFAGLLFELPTAVAPLTWLTITRPALDALGSTVDVPTLAATARSQGHPGFLVPFRIDYAHDSAHVVDRWAVLGGSALGFVLLTGVCLWARDPGSRVTRISGRMQRMGQSCWLVRQQLRQHVAAGFRTAARVMQERAAPAVARAWPVMVRGVAVGRWLVRAAIGEEAAPPVPGPAGVSRPVVAAAGAATGPWWRRPRRPPHRRLARGHGSGPRGERLTR
jgi:ABC transport system ATP-binding/permease protein